MNKLKPLTCKLGFHKYKYNDIGYRFRGCKKVVKCDKCGKVKAI